MSTVNLPVIPNPVSSATDSVSTWPPRLHALLIGISDYPSNKVNNLRGGIADATHFKEYLEGDLKIPGDQIISLHGPEATRAAIIKGLEDLKDNKAIQLDDPIFIFYAGHGAQEEAASPPDPRKRYEVLIPYDFSPEIPAITDRELAKLVHDISKAKGDNITLVLDCCHSASVDRGSPLVSDGSSSSVLARGLDHVLPRSQARPDERGIAALGPESEGIFSLRNHMLIAACQSTETAKEINGAGLFSTALLALLRRTGPHLKKLRYSDILERLDDIHGQNPQCLGVHHDRFIFNQKIEGAPGQRRFKVDIKLSEKQIILQAGSANGVNKGDQFAIYGPLDDSNYSGTNPLGTLTVSEALVDSSIMALDPKSGFSLFAVRTSTAKRSDLYLHIPGGDKPHIQELIRKHVSELNIEVTDDELHADLQLTAHVSTGKDKKVEAVEIRVIDLKPPTAVADYQSVNRVELGPHFDDDISCALQHAARYFWQLHREGDNSISQYVKVGFYKLKANLKADYDEVGKNLCVDSKIELNVEVDVPYGIKLINTSQMDLFPALFYFNHSDFSIAPYYVHPEPGADYEVEPPLRKRESLTIGYGHLGAQPFVYDIPDGQSIDFGYLKVFLFTQAVKQVEDIQQDSPFLKERGMRKIKKGSQSTIWGTITIPIIQRQMPTI